MAVSTIAPQQGLWGSRTKRCCELLCQTLRRSSLQSHAATHRSPVGRTGILGSSELIETFLAPLEEMLPGEKQAKQNPNPSVITTNQASAAPAWQQNSEETQRVPQQPGNPIPGRRRWRAAPSSPCHGPADAVGADVSSWHPQALVRSEGSSHPWPRTLGPFPW